jgi:hypothetical protein
VKLNKVPDQRSRPAPRACSSSSSWNIVRAIFAGIAMLFAAASCDMIGAISDIQAQGNAAAMELEKALGTKPQVGFNIFNGTLTNVTFSFDASRLSKYTVADLNRLAVAAVQHHFKQQPKVVIVNLQWAGGALPPDKSFERTTMRASQRATPA